MNNFDTTKFVIFYDRHESVNAFYDFNQKIELSALSRASRDIIALSLKCFAAQTCLINSQIIKSLPDMPQERQTMVEVLLDLEQSKKELYN